MHKEYLPTDLETKRVHIIEEMGEVLTLYGKIQRFGELSVDPTIPPEEQITNIEAFHNELNDLDGAIGRYFVHYYTAHAPEQFTIDPMRTMTID